MSPTPTVKELEFKVHQLQHELNRRRQRERDLLASEELHRVTLNSISDAVFITDDQGRFTFICPNVHTIFGYSQQEVAQLGTIFQLIGDAFFDPAALSQDKSHGDTQRAGPPPA